MKKQLRQELMDLAKTILRQKHDDELSAAELQEQARRLYEKLTVLNAAEQFLLGASSPEKTEGNIPVEKQKEEPKAPAPEKKEAPKDLFEDEHDEYAPDGTEYNDSDGITEPNTEKIKDIVAQMPPESQEVDDMLEYIMPKKQGKKDMEDIGGVHYDHLPQFEPVDLKQKQSKKPQSLNDRLKKGIQIGINDRHAFVRHLFDGSNADYNRVLSQLNTLKTKEEAIDFVLNMVKPDYNNWEGKEEYESRFLEIIENKFD